MVYRNIDGTVEVLRLVDGSVIVRCLDESGFAKALLFFEKQSESSHVALDALPFAVAKGDLVVIGGLAGVADMSAAAGAAGSVNAGKPVSVFSVSAMELAAAPVVGTVLYVSRAGLTVVAEEAQAPLGTVVAVHGAAVDIVRLWR